MNPTVDAMPTEAPSTNANDNDTVTATATEAPRSSRVEGLVDLVADTVVHGARLVEQAHRGVTDRNFWLLKQLPVPYAEVPVGVVETVHNAHLTVVYGSIRGVARAVQVVASAALTSARTTSSSREAAVEGK
jgi:hypothetical protein